jgi:hypothetical protein
MSGKSRYVWSCVKCKAPGIRQPCRYLRDLRHNLPHFTLVGATLYPIPTLPLRFNMTRLMNLPTELRQEILEYVISALAWLDSPDIEALQPKDWICHGSAFRVFRANLKSPLLTSLLLVNRAFFTDTIYIWKHFVGPNLRVPVLNIDCVGPGVERHRPVQGVIVKWLSLPISFAKVDEVEIRIRYHDHQLCYDGQQLHLGRLHPLQRSTRHRREVRPSLQEALHQVVTQFWKIKLPPLQRYPATEFTALKILKIVFDTSQADGLHWLHVGPPYRTMRQVRYVDESARLPVAIHPYVSFMWSMVRIQDFFLNTGGVLHRTTCEVYIDHHLVVRWKALTVKDDNIRGPLREQFPYTVPVDPVLSS